MNVILESVLQRGDLAHLVLFLWAVSASVLLLLAFRESASSNRRFDAFLHELIRFNNRHKIGGEE